MQQNQWFFKANLFLCFVFWHLWFAGSRGFADNKKELTEMLAILSRVEFLLAPQVLYTTRPDVRRGKLPKPSTEIKDPFQVLYEIKSALITLFNKRYLI